MLSKFTYHHDFCQLHFYYQAGQIWRIDFAQPGDPSCSDKSSFAQEIKRQFDLYFAGKLKVFELSYKLELSDFQEQVLHEVSQIKYGETKSYQEIARLIHRPKAWRAVGSANNKNPLPILIPCHRVIGSDGKLKGYGGGIKLKENLINLESGHYSLD